MKKRVFRVISALCALFAVMSCLNFGGVTADENEGCAASVFAYTLNDCLYTYGAVSTENAGDSFEFASGDAYPRGVLYSEIIKFEPDKEPYLAIFTTNPDYTVVSCQLWRCDKEKDCAEEIASLDVNYSQLTDGRVGVFSMGFYEDKRYILYKTYENDALIGEECYTAIDGVAYRCVKTPNINEEIGVADFSSSYFHPGTDVSNYNKTLGDFFDKLKNASADSVTYEDIAERLSDEDEEQIENVLGTVTGFTDFDIANYTTMDEYRAAVDARPEGDRFYLISEAYNLGDEIYYVRFSTERSYYNYALLRRSDDAPDGYQILKVKTDCIPLSDRELKQIKTDYDRNTLLYKKAKGALSLNDNEDDKDNGSKKKPLINIDKKFDSSMRLPAICVGGGIAVALLTLLWVYMYSDGD